MVAGLDDEEHKLTRTFHRVIIIHCNAAWKCVRNHTIGGGQVSQVCIGEKKKKKHPESSTVNNAQT